MKSGNANGSRGKNARRGVVLLDVILALAVISLAALVLMPGPRPGISSSELHAEAVRVAAQFRQGRALALRNRGHADILVDPDTRRVRVEDGLPLQLDEGIELEWVTSDQCPLRGGLRALRFLADGRSCGGLLTLSGGGSSTQLRVDWLTGRVEMSDL